MAEIIENRIERVGIDSPDASTDINGKAPQPFATSLTVVSPAK
jgi:hypothetical protein